MDLFTFLTAPANLPFSISAVFLVLLLAFEILGVLVSGVGLSHLADLDHDAAEVDGGFAADALAYLHWGKVPVIIILSALTGLFALAGLGVQSLAGWIGGGLLPAWIASIPALVGAIWGSHKLVLPLSKLMPSEEGDAMREAGFVGLPGRVTIGPCRKDAPGEATIRDADGREHYVRVKPADDTQVLPVHAEIAITGRTPDGNVYLAVPLFESPELSSSSDPDTAEDADDRARAALSVTRQERQS